MVATEMLDVACSREAEFLERIRDIAFPCVGAKAAAARGNLAIVHARSLASAWNDLEIHEKLLEWSASIKGSEELHSFAVVFEGPECLDEETFEQLLWQRLQSLADKDAWKGQRYDKAVNADVDHPHFSLSFGGEGFFVVGLHPNASRPARRFSNPVLVFNLHRQFVRLREEGRYGRMHERIMARDKALAGSTNPMLADHGTASAARQYSGRIVSADWKCPFQDPRA